MRFVLRVVLCDRVWPRVTDGIYHILLFYTLLLRADSSAFRSAVFEGGDTLATPAFTRPFPISRVTTFVAVDGGGMLRDGIGKDGIFPEENIMIMYPSDNKTTEPMSK